MTASPTVALIGGTGFLEAPTFQNAIHHKVETPHGPVTLLEQNNTLFLQRHGIRTYTPPHKINHRAHIQALQQAGAERILAVSSVGSLHRELPPGAMVVPDDFFAPHLSISFFDDQQGHKTPGFHEEWREHILDAWRRTDLMPAIDGGVYWQSLGPRFETPAEISFYQSHVHLVGMTIASECILAGELGLPYAAICMVDNYANGLENTPLSLESFHAQVKARQHQRNHVIETLLRVLCP